MSRIRIERINDELKVQLSNIIQKLEDPRLHNQIISVVRVDTSSDLSHSKVFISSLNSEHNPKIIIGALKSATGFIRHQLAQKIKLRIVPQLHFIYDSTIEYSFYMQDKIKNNFEN